MHLQLGDILLKKGLITSDQLHIALLEQQKQHRFLSEILIDLGFVAPAIVGEFLSAQTGYTHLELHSLDVNYDLILHFGLDQCRELLVIPFKLDKALHVAMVDPENVVLQDHIKKQSLSLFETEPNRTKLGFLSHL